LLYLKKTDTFVDMPLQDPKQRKKLNTDGIIKIKLPTSSFIKDCYNILQLHLTDFPGQYQHGFFQGVLLNDTDIKYAIHNALKEVITPLLTEISPEYRSLAFSFLIKGTGESSKLNPHQDWSIVDERKFTSYTLWIPLSESTPENGTVYAYKGSHLFKPNIRGGGIPPKYLSCRDEILKKMIPYSLKEGEALLFNSKLLHYSPDNQSTQPRVAIATNLIPNAAKLYLYNCKDHSKSIHIDKYAIPDDFNLRYNNFLIEKDLIPAFGEYEETIKDGNTYEVTVKEFIKIQRTGLKNIWRKLFNYDQ
jgi:hypothetical protein